MGIGDYRCHLVIKSGKLEVKQLEFYKDFVSKLWCFLNEEDFRKIINEYLEDILNYVVEKFSECK